MIISDESYPNIVGAFHCIQEDSGVAIRPPVFDIPDRWGKHLAEIETVIGTLSKTERAPEEGLLPPHVKPDAYLDSEYYTYCNGEHDVMIAMCNRSLGHQMANILLTDFFEDWSYTQDSGPETPGQKTLARRIEYLEMVEREGSEGLTEIQRQELERLRSELM